MKEIFWWKRKCRIESN